MAGNAVITERSLSEIPALGEGDLCHLPHTPSDLRTYCGAPLDCPPHPGMILWQEGDDRCPDCGRPECPECIALVRRERQRG